MEGQAADQRPSDQPSKNETPTKSPRKGRLSLKGRELGERSKTQRKLTTTFLGPVSSSKTSTASSDVKRSSAVRPETVPSVAVLHNLGNTCFLNSVLQILRYTPHFVSQLSLLAGAVKQTREDQARVLGHKGTDSDDDDTSQLTCSMVLHLNELFSRMRSREESHRRRETSYIALRPYDVLHTLQKLNCMFEGGEQQDAHELLHCLLSYIHDALTATNRLRRLLNTSIPQLDGNCDEKTRRKRSRLSKEKIESVGDELEEKRGVEGGKGDRNEMGSLDCVADGTREPEHGVVVSPKKESCSVLLNDVIQCTEKACVPETIFGKLGVKKVSHNRARSWCGDFEANGEDESLKPVKTYGGRKRKLSLDSEVEKTVVDGVTTDVSCERDRSEKKLPEVVNSVRKSKRLGMTRRVVNTAPTTSGLFKSNEKIAKSTPLAENVKKVTQTTMMYYSTKHTENESKSANDLSLGAIPKKQTARKSCGAQSLMRKTCDDEELVRKALSRQVVVRVERCATPSITPSTAPQHKRPATLPIPNPFQHMFMGSMALRTRCIECENHTERREEYQALTVPVTSQHSSDSDTDDDDDEGDEWLVSKLCHVERLTGENKFTCERCVHLVEAERSSHLVTVPRIITLHQIRFTATKSVDCQLAKISEYRPTPLVLPCLLDSCKKGCTDPTHRYELYGVVLHTGVSMSCGHYTAYVRAPPTPLSLDNTSTNQDTCLPIPRKPENTDSKNSSNSVNESMDGVTSGTQDSPKDSDSSSVLWYECDDDVVRELTADDMKKVLSASGIGTPYLLFYWPAVAH